MFIQKRNQQSPFFPLQFLFYIKKECAASYIAGDHFYASGNKKMGSQVTSLNSAFKVQNSHKTNLELRHIFKRISFIIEG